MLYSILVALAILCVFGIFASYSMAGLICVVLVFTCLAALLKVIDWHRTA